MFKVTDKKLINTWVFNSIKMRENCREKVHTSEMCQLILRTYFYSEGGRCRKFNHLDMRKYTSELPCNIKVSESRK